VVGKQYESNRKRDGQMAATIKTSVSIPEALFNQAEILAQRLHISQSDLYTMALEYFIRNEQSQTSPDDVSQPDPPEPATSTADDKRLIINQGDIYWLQIDNVSGSEPGIRHPHVVIQDDIFNHSRIHTVVVCALTSNLKRTNLPGNVLLDIGEGNLAKQSVVEVSKVSSVDKLQLGEFIGTLSEERIHQVLAGMRLLERSFFAE
jgi:mRNA interferase MazF